MLKNSKEYSLHPQEVKVSLKNSLNVKVKKNEHRDYRVSATRSSKTVKIVGLIADRTSRYSGARCVSLSPSLSHSFSLSSRITIVAGISGRRHPSNGAREKVTAPSTFG